MKEKDIAEKILEDYPDVFADIVNGFLFSGNEVVKPEELEDMQLRSAYCGGLFCTKTKNWHIRRIQRHDATHV